MFQLAIAAWFISSAALALGVAVACDKVFGTFSTGPWLAPVRTRPSSKRRANSTGRQEKKSA